MELNLLKATVGQKAYQPIEITEIEFWEHYLSLLNLRGGFWINQKIIQVFSWVLAHDPDVSWFSKPHSDKMKEAIPSLSDSEITRIRKTLLELNLAKESPDPMDRRKNLTYPVDNLRKFQLFIKKSNTVTFIFPYEIAE